MPLQLLTTMDGDRKVPGATTWRRGTDLPTVRGLGELLSWNLETGPDTIAA
jgi:hypothetical protein